MVLQLALDYPMMLHFRIQWIFIIRCGNSCRLKLQFLTRCLMAIAFALTLPMLNFTQAQLMQIFRVSPITQPIPTLHIHLHLVISDLFRLELLFLLSSKCTSKLYLCSHWKYISTKRQRLLPVLAPNVCTMVWFRGVPYLALISLKTAINRVQTAFICIHPLIWVNG